MSSADFLSNPWYICISTLKSCIFCSGFCHDCNPLQALSIADLPSHDRMFHADLYHSRRKNGFYSDMVITGSSSQKKRHVAQLKVSHNGIKPASSIAKETPNGTSDGPMFNANYWSKKKFITSKQAKAMVANAFDCDPCPIHTTFPNPDARCTRFQCKLDGRRHYSEARRITVRHYISVLYPPSSDKPLKESRILT